MRLSTCSFISNICKGMKIKSQPSTGGLGVGMQRLEVKGQTVMEPVMQLEMPLAVIQLMRPGNKLPEQPSSAQAFVEHSQCHSANRLKIRGMEIDGTAKGIKKCFFGLENQVLLGTFGINANSALLSSQGARSPKKVQAKRRFP